MFNQVVKKFGANTEVLGSSTSELMPAPLGCEVDGLPSYNGHNHQRIGTLNNNIK